MQSRQKIRPGIRGSYDNSQMKTPPKLAECCFCTLGAAQLAEEHPFIISARSAQVAMAAVASIVKTCIILTTLINRSTTHRVVQATGNLSDIHISDRNHVTIAGFFDEYVHLPGDHLTLVLHLVAGDEVFPICVVT